MGCCRRFVSATTAALQAASTKQRQYRNDIRNIAVIAHVDHGKTTLVDALLKQSGTVSNARGRVMDSRDQEKERGITILAKNTALVFNDQRRINVVDTPGHLDFGGEVERALHMVEGFILLVDAKESVMPGTRYVLRKALSLNLKPIVVLNKIDKDDTNITKTVREVEDLFLETASDDNDLDLHFLYGSGKIGYFNDTPIQGGTLQPLFDALFKYVPPPSQTEGSAFRFLVAQVEEGEHGWRIAIGRVFAGTVEVGQVVLVVLGEKRVKTLVRGISQFAGVVRTPTTSASFGDIVAITLEPPVEQKIPLEIGASLCDEKRVEPCPYRPPDDPIFSILFSESKASWKGKEVMDARMGRMDEIRQRLEREALVNSALKLRVEPDGILAMGRGPLHLSVIIEDMRRQGYEFELSAPSTIKKVINDVVHEPFERVSMDFKEEHMSAIASQMALRCGEVGDIKPAGQGRLSVDVVLPVRLMLDWPMVYHRLTQGDGILRHCLDSFRPASGDATIRTTGALVCVEDGEVTSYGLQQLAQHGRFFVEPGDKVYYSQIVGENAKLRLQDVPVNVTKRNEQLGGFRANSNDTSARSKSGFVGERLTLEDGMAWICAGEVVSVTPKAVRLRKLNFSGKTTMRRG